MTWPSAVKWDGGSAPTLASSPVEENVITLLTRDEGVTWYGWETLSTIKSKYQLWMWGYNGQGQLGQNNKTGYSSPVQVPGEWTSLHQSTDASYQTFVSKTAGSLWAMGFNGSGNLGQNNVTYYSSPVQIPGTTWDTAHSSEQNNLATRSDGTLWTWGVNNYGSLGLNQAYAQLEKLSSPVQIPGTTWSKISGSSGIGFAIKTDGTLWAWGSNSYGQLAVNDLTQRSSPTQIPGTWSDVSGTGRHSAAIKTNGTLWTWGRNRGGALGLNQAVNNTDYSSPVQVPGTWTQPYVDTYNIGALKST